MPPTTFCHSFDSRWLAAAIVLLAVTGLSLFLGCSRDKADEMFASVNASNIQRVANLYCVYQAQNNFVGPENEEQFKNFISQMHPSRHKSYGINVDRLDELFISERDNQPLKIRWKLVAKPRQGPIPIAFESEGRNGKFMVAFSSFEIGEFDLAEYEQLWAGKRDEEISADNRGGPTGRGN